MPLPPCLPPPPPAHPTLALTAASLLSSPLMLGVYVTIFILLAAILFVCAVYSCVTVSTGRADGWELGGGLGSV